MARPRAQHVEQSSWVTDREQAATHDLHGRPMLRLQTLGAAVIQCGELLRITPSAGVLFALLLRLTHAPGMRVSRNVLLESLWPEQVDSRRRGSLRQALYKLRSYDVRVGHGGSDIELDATQVLRTFSVERTSDRFEREVTLGREPFGTFLPGYAPHWPAVAEWLQVEREAVHADIRRVLVQQLRAHRERADWSGAEPLARWLLQFDPLHEDATLMLAECTMLAGAKAEAISILDRYLAEIGPGAGDIRLPATLLRRRLAAEGRGRLSFAPTERHFVGREQEIADLTMAMRRSRWHDGSAVLYHGPAGIGKTRLTLEAAKVAAIEGIREVRIACRESDAQRPLAIFLEVLPSLIALPGALGCEPASLKTLRRLVGERIESRPENDSADLNGDTADIEESVEVAPEGTRVDLDVDRVVQSVDSVDREPLPMLAAVRSAVADLLSALSHEKPVLLSVDDAQWMDSASWEMIVELIARVGSMRLTLVLTSRVAHACAVRPSRIPGILEVRRLRALSTSSRRALTAMLSEDLDVSIDEHTSDWLAEASEGVPLILRALLVHWAETGEAHGVPPTLAQAIELRLSSLSGIALSTLQAAALLGRHATAGRLQQVLALTTVQLVQALDELSEAGAFRETTGEDVIIHELLGQYAVGRMGGPSCKAMHARIADVLARVNADFTGAIAISAVDHMRRAGQHRRLVEYVLQHGTEFLQQGSPTSALALCNAAKDVKTSPRRAIELQRMEMEALYATGLHAQLLTMSSQSGIAFAIDDSWDTTHAGDVLSFIESEDFATDYADYGEICARAILLAEATSVPADLRYKGSATALKIAGHGLEPAIARRAYEAGQAVLDSVASPAFRSQMLDIYFHTVFGDLGAAIRSATAILPRCTELGPSPDQMRLRSDVSLVQRVSGDVAAARTGYQLVFSHAMKRGETSVAGIAAWYLSLHALDRMDGIEESKLWIERCAQLPGARSQELLCHVIEQQRARIAVLQGDLVSATRHSRLSKHYFSKASHPKRRASESALDLAVAVLGADLDQIGALLPEARNRFLRLRGLLGQDYLASQLILAHRLLSERSESAAIFEEYVRVFRRERFDLPEFLTDALTGELPTPRRRL